MLSTNPTTVHVHRDGTIDITQNTIETLSSPQPLPPNHHPSTSLSPASSNFQSSPASRSREAGTDEDDRAFEQSLLRLRQLASMDTGIATQSYRSSLSPSPSLLQPPHLPPPLPPQTRTPSRLPSPTLDQKRRVDELDIELRAARAREEALRERLMSAAHTMDLSLRSNLDHAEMQRKTEETNHRATAEMNQIRQLQQASAQRVEQQAAFILQRKTEETNRAVAEMKQIRQLQLASVQRVEEQAISMMQRNTEETNRSQLARFETKLRERSAQNIREAQEEIEQRKETAFRIAAEREEHELQTGLDAMSQHMTRIHQKRLRTLSIAMSEKKEKEEQQLKTQLEKQQEEELLALKERLHVSLLSELSTSEHKLREHWKLRTAKIHFELEEKTKISLQERLLCIRTEEEEKYTKEVQQYHDKNEAESTLTIDQLRQRLQQEYCIKLQNLQSSLSESIDRQRNSTILKLKDDLEKNIQKKMKVEEKTAADAMDLELDSERRKNEAELQSKLRYLREQLNNENEETMERSRQRIRNITQKSIQQEEMKIKNEYEQELIILRKKMKNDESNALIALRTKLEKEKVLNLSFEKEKLIQEKNEKITMLQNDLHENTEKDMSQLKKKLQREHDREISELKKRCGDEQRQSSLEIQRQHEDLLRTATRSVTEEYARLEERMANEISTNIENQTNDLKRKEKEKNHLKIVQLRRDGEQKLHREVNTCLTSMKTELENEKQSVINEMNSIQTSEIEKTKAQAILNKEQKLNELRNRMKIETTKTTDKIMASLTIENIEHLRLHRATIESELREEHEQKLNMIKTEAKDALLANEKLIRTTLMANHKEKQMELLNNLTEYHRTTMAELKYELELHSVKSLKKAKRKFY